MKKFLLLFLLGCWSHVGAKELPCNTGVAFSGYAISIPSTELAGAHAFLLRAYTSTKLYDCLEDCCLAKYGICSVVEFHNDTEESNCFHYSCQPLHNCKFMNARATDSFTFPGLSKGYDPQENVVREGENGDHFIADQILKSGDSSPHISGEPREHTRAVSARKGVEMSTPFSGGKSFPEPTKVVPVNERPNLPKMAFKNDNTTIKPRKGVDSSHEEPASGIKPRKGVDTVLHSTPGKKVLDSVKSKVKPRKGVEPFTTSPEEAMTTSSYHSSSSYLLSKLPIKSSSSSLFEDTSQTEFMTMLEQIFQDDPSFMNSSTKSSYSILNSTITVSSSSQPITISPASVAVTTEGTSELSILSSMQEAGTEKYRKTSLSTQDLTSSRVHVDQLNTIQSTPPFIAKTVTSALHLKTASIESSTAAEEEAESSTISKAQYSTQSPIKATSKVNTPLPTNSSNSTRFVLSQSVVMDAESERKYKSSMHLVLSLIFGLMVLLVVLGAVAKRVYDVWMRRHYHRMDFLIDGMYDGYS